MNLPLTKVWRDLWSNKSRTILVVMAIAVGVTAFGGVYSSKDLLISGMKTQYQATHPAAITISIPAFFSDDVVRFIETQKGVQAARGIGQGLVRYYTPQGARNVLLEAIDFSRSDVSKIIPETGKWPPERKELVLERKSLQVAGLKLGNNFPVELPNGDKRTLTIVGSAHDYQTVPATLFPQLTGYVSFSTLTALGFPDLFRTLQIVTTPDITTKEAAQTLGDHLKHLLEQRGFTDIAVSADKPGKHWGEDPSNAFVTILTVVGSFSLVLSIFLVVNTISAMIAQQRRQIGIMKAIGGTNRQLIRLYLVMAGVLGILALAIALPLGAAMSYGTLVLVTQFLNLDVVGFTIPLWIAGLEVVAAIGVPLLAALIPVILGVKVTVREALSDLVTGNRQSPFIDRLTTTLTFVTRPTLLSIRNTFRKKGRLAMTLATLTVAGTLFFSVSSVQRGMFLELDTILNLYHYDIELFFGQAYDSQLVKRAAIKSSGITFAETPVRVGGYLVKNGETTNNAVNLTGVPPQTDFMQPKIIAGRWLKPGDRNQVVISSKMVRDDPTLGPGKEITVTINNQDSRFQVVGVYMLMDEANGIVTDSYLKKLTPDANQVSSVQVQTQDHSSQGVAVAAKNLEQDLKKAGFNVAYSLTIDTIRSSSVGQFNFMIMFLLLMAGMVAVVGGLGLAGTMSLNVLERTREIGVMRSIGAANTSIRQLVAIEGMLIGWISWALAIPLSIPIGFGFCYAVGKAFFENPLIFTFSVSGSLIWLLMVTVIAALASIAPANRAARLTIRETLAYE